MSELKIVSTPEIGPDRRFVTQVVIQGIGALTFEGRHAHVYQSAIRGKQPFVRFDVEDQTFCIPLGLILMVAEGPAKELPEVEKESDGGEESE